MRTMWMGSGAISPLLSCALLCGDIMWVIDGNRSCCGCCKPQICILQLVPRELISLFLFVGFKITHVHTQNIDEYFELTIKKQKSELNI